MTLGECPMNLSKFILQLGSMKHYIIACVLVFLIGVVLGYQFTDLFQTLLSAQMDRMSEMVKGLVQGEHRQWHLFILIFTNNLFVCLLVIVLGIFFGIMPLYFLISNGLLLGYLASQRMNGETWFYFLKGIVPHGIIEIPALILACAFGVRFGFLTGEGCFSLFSAERRSRVIIKIREIALIMVPLAAVLGVMFFVAAIIESTFTYWLIN
jgi:stage II sporulation protein M